MEIDAEGPRTPSVAVCLLTTGNRPTELATAIESARRAGFERVVVLDNGSSTPVVAQDAEVIRSDENLGVPGGRQRLADDVDADLLFFLDDDAEVLGDGWAEVIRRFVAEPDLAVVSLHLVDEVGGTARRHIPRAGRTGVDSSGRVATFLGGASIIRRSALMRVGGYWSELFYGHEELELSWRLYDSGDYVFYDASATVFHPKTEIERHAEGWRLTGRNRVMIARRDLPWPVALVHVGVWAAAGSIRAGGLTNARAYLSGWWSGWFQPVDRQPIAWSTVAEIAKAGRPPII